MFCPRCSSRLPATVAPERHPARRLFWRRSALALTATAFLLSTAPLVEAAPRRTGKYLKKGARNGGPSAAATRSKAKADEGQAVVASGKVAVLPFEGDDSEPLRKHVIKLFRDRGLNVDATLRPVDTAEQYRDMGAALDLAVFVHGRIKDTTQDHAIATIVIRSGVSGRKVATAAFNGFRRGLPFDVEEKLWERVGTAFSRACVEAAKPGVRHHNAPMVIEAGTPL
jgi:hypothetical protein